MGNLLFKLTRLNTGQLVSIGFFIGWGIAMFLDFI